MKLGDPDSEELQRVVESLGQEFRWRRSEEIAAVVAEARETLGPADDLPRLKQYCRERLEGRVARSYRHFQDWHTA